MNNLKIEGTSKIPAVTFDAGKGLLDIKGRSITENAMRFYQPMIEWLTDYLNDPAEETIFNITFEYINSSSVVWLMKMLKKMETAYRSGRKIIVNWYYCDEDIMDAGEDIKAILDIPFKMIKSN
ncbi:MAG: DUF1987 domain-containing protein [Bacteroidetes bacterium]|nr:DUF1987 domain-containing protein [Bacteroidota bacterium]